METVHDKRFWVRIRAGKSQGDCKTVYYKTGLPFFVRSKWDWYFKYRAALYQVANPRHYCEFESGSYNYTPTEVEQAKRLKDKITGKKATISKYENRVQAYASRWNSLFPITDFEPYKTAVEKIEKLKQELKELMNA